MQDNRTSRASDVASLWFGAVEVPFAAVDDGIPLGLDARLGGILLVPTADDPPAPGEWALVQRDVLSTLMDSDDDGLRMPAFTTPAALRRWRPDGGTYVERATSWFFGVAAADPEGRAVIDPGSPDELVLDTATVAALAVGRDPTAPSSDGGTSVLIATPLEGLAPDVAAAVHDALAPEPLVDSARLFLVDADRSGPQPVVVVRPATTATAADIDDLMGRVVGRIAATTDQAAGLRFQVADHTWRDAFESGGLPLFDR